MPVQEFPVGLDGGHHARQHVLAAELALDFRPDARPGAGGELAQQLAVEAGVQSQAFGDGQDDLPVRDGKADVFGHVDSRQQRPISRIEFEIVGRQVRWSLWEGSARLHTLTDRAERAAGFLEPTADLLEMLAEDAARD
jgi:hypothetical protein